MLGLVIICHLLSEEYSYREELNTPFTALIGEFYYEGHVNRDGIFIPDNGSPPCPRMEYIFHGGGGRRLLSRSHGFSKVYELRYGMLIPMTIYANGKFIPEEGMKIIRFEDYRYWVFARPIYNLPGTWVKKGRVFDTDETRQKNITFKPGK